MADRILFIVDNLPRGHFFGRFVSAAQACGASVRFLAYRRSSYRLLHGLGYDADILGQRSNSNIPNSDRDRFRDECKLSLEVVSGDTDLRAALRTAPVLAGQIDAAIQVYSPTHLFLWNGSQLIERLTASVCPPEVTKRYFEIANLQGKMFLDRKGVNAASSLYDSPDSLLGGDIPSDEEFESWRRENFDAQISRGVPQAKAALAFQWERPADALASRLGYGFYPIGIRPILSRFVGKLMNSTAAAELVNEYQVPEGSTAAYRFFPLQVSGDTQLLLNSDIGNLDALRRVFSECRRDGINLVVKIHPAENNRLALEKLRSVLNESRARGGIYLSNQPTTSLIRNSEKVYTINSTVGLETLIAGKPLEVLGRAFYQHFVGRPDLLKCYLLRYLIPFDYFGSDEASPELLTRILAGWPMPTARHNEAMVCGS